jgi:cell division protein FtsB
MKRNNPAQITLTVNIPDAVYRRVSHVIKAGGLEEVSAIQKIISVGLLKLKIDAIEAENASLFLQIDNLKRETNNLIEEIKNLEKLCSEAQRDSDYISKRLEKLNAENEELEAFIRPTTLRGSRRKLDGNV